MREEKVKKREEKKFSKREEASSTFGNPFGFLVS
jgi:hypothetical protein